MNYFIYIVRCSDNSLYIGSSSNVEKRVVDHNLGKGAFTTRKKRPVKLVYYEIYDSKEAAILREMQLKGWSRAKKENLIKYGHPYQKA